MYIARGPIDAFDTGCKNLALFIQSATEAWSRVSLAKARMPAARRASVDVFRMGFYSFGNRRGILEMLAAQGCAAELVGCRIFELPYR